jgi:EmrB/QacA subfamily drug resistance transporter
MINVREMKKWGPLAILAAAQFLMVLDQAVMNVSISQLVDDLDTSVTAIQIVITLYSLVMAMFMITGGKIGDLVGRRRAFIIGLIIYGFGSALTAVAPSVQVLALGWSVLEGLGAALVLPALAALIAGNYVDRDRSVAYAVIGGVAGAGIAVGPILGGWATTELSWRVVFVGEVVVVAAILVSMRLLKEAPGPEHRPRLDVLGSVLSAVGLGLIVIGVLQASSWGWIMPKNSPITILGFSLSPFLVALGAFTLWLFVRWQRLRVQRGTDPLIHLEILKIKPVFAGLQTMLAQNLILMGIFFVTPLYLQLVLGFNALETGIRMLPVSVGMLVASVCGSWLATKFSVRSIVRVGLITIVVAVVVLLASIEPDLQGIMFGVAMALLGVGMGLIASQLGNVVQSSVDASGRSEAGGLQYTAQQLGSAVGVALIGAIVLSGLASNFITRITDNPEVPAAVTEQATISVSEGVSFVTADQVLSTSLESGIPPEIADQVVADYEDAQLKALRVGLLATVVIAAIALFFTKGLPSRKPDGDEQHSATAVD